MPETEGVVWEEYHDRTAGLMIFGLVQIGLGVLAVLFCAILALSLVSMAGLANGAIPGAGMPTATFQQLIPVYILGGLTLVAAAIVLTTLGAGSIMARRWARTLSLALWTMALAYGILMALTWVFSVASFGQMMEESMQAQMQRSAAAGRAVNSPPPAMASFMTVFMLAFTVLFGIGVPLPFVLFYRSKHVKATCEWRDPVPRWTDSRPVPVIVASLLMLMVATMCVQQGISNSFYFGVALSGVAGLVGAVVLGAVFVAATVGLLMMRSWGWWIATVAMVLQTLVWLYAAAMGKTDIFNSSLYMAGTATGSAAFPDFLGHTLWTMAIGFLVLSVYLVWLRRYFRPVSTEVSAA